GPDRFDARHRKPGPAPAHRAAHGDPRGAARIVHGKRRHSRAGAGRVRCVHHRAELVSEGSLLVIAAAQSLVSSDIAANGAAIRQLIAGAATSGARHVVFCEGALSGYAKNQIASPQSWRNYDWAG